MAAPLVALAGKALASQATQELLSDPRVRKAIGALVAFLLALPIAGLMVLTAITAAVAQNVGGSQDTVPMRCDHRQASGPGAGDLTTIDELDDEQIDNAATIISVVRAAHLIPAGVTDAPERDEVERQAAKVALATAMQESSLRNIDHGDRDSIGLFQQRPSMDWGTPEQILDPVYTTTAFLYGAGTNKGLVDVSEWWTLPLTVAAQAVQRSGFPDAYARWAPLAGRLTDELWEHAQATATHPDLDRDDLDDPDRKTTVRVPGGDPECGIYDGQVPTWDGEYKTPGPWGGFSNGKIPTSALCMVPFAAGHYLHCDAVDALVALNKAYRADHDGKNLIVVSAYRSYERQVAIKREYCNTGRCHLAAPPGLSNHGWGLAVDLGQFGGVGDYTQPNYHWMMDNAPAYGWVNPPHMQHGGKGPLEPWHWEFMGTPQEGLPGTGADDPDGETDES